jgi:hypothetical protein
MRLARRGFAFAALSALVLLSACGDDNDDNGDVVDLSGQYTLTKYEAGAGGNYQEVEGTTGTFVLTSTEYAATLNIPGLGEIVDAGTYTAIGTEASGDFTQDSNTSDTQATGTYTFNATTGELVLSTTVNGVDQRVTLLLD